MSVFPPGGLYNGDGFSNNPHKPLSAPSALGNFPTGFPSSGFALVAGLTNSAANLRFRRPLWKAASTVVGAIGFVTFLFVQFLTAVVASKSDHSILALYCQRLILAVWLVFSILFPGFTIEDI